MSGVIRLLLADDQALVRGAMATLLGLEADLDRLEPKGCAFFPDSILR